ncbi:MAG: hypothetical protein HC811_06790 [Flammeovirgaceae bacterium]|nr:hypothetical protein [Flammeovirgaceae bacterium]
MRSVRATIINRYQKGESAVIDSVPWTVGIHESEKDGMYYIVEIRSLVAPGLQDFDEIRASIISDYQDYLEKEWVKELRTKYAIKVNNKAKTTVLNTLVKK